MTLTAVTANFGCASPAPPGVQARRRERAEQHAQMLRAQEVDLVLAQEIPAIGWIESWRSAGYAVITEEQTPYAVRSAVISRHTVTPVSLRSAAYHGSYLAAASVELDCGPVTLVSVHASPSPLTAEHIASGTALIRGAQQRIGGRTGQWWDADFVLGTLADLVSDGHHVLAAGDYNECRRWDETHPGTTWGQQYFENVRQAGLTSVTSAHWTRERQTYLGSDAGYQLDHVLASADVAPLIDDVTLQSWEPNDVESGTSPDHAWIGFSITDRRACV